MQHPKLWLASELRAKKDMMELSSQRFTCPHATTVVQLNPNGNSGGNVVGVTMSFSGGYYAGGTFVLSLTLPGNYPFRPPQVYCLTRVWHPNVELVTGRVSHPLLEGDWKPVQSINAVILGIQLLFLEPNPEHPANPIAASAFNESPERFAAQVRRTLRGGVCFDLEFPPQLRRLKRSREPHVDEEDEAMDLNDDVESLSLAEGQGDDHLFMAVKRPCVTQIPAQASFPSVQKQPNRSLNSPAFVHHQPFLVDSHSL